VVAVPEGGAGVVRIVDPGPAAQQPVDLFLISLQIWIRVFPGAPITGRAVHRIAMPLIGAPLKELAMQLR
jgi:hypothetical protein